MIWQYHDGGRMDAGFRGHAGDCFVRSVAIVTNMPYKKVYDEINETAKMERPRNGRRRSNARLGIKTRIARRYLKSLGYEWIPTMQIGIGCKVHLQANQLPHGALIVRVSRHFTAIINGVIYDTFDPGRNGMTCVYGYWQKTEE